MATAALKSENLENDEFLVECEIRQLHGPLKTLFRLLDARLLAEETDVELKPTQPHKHGLQNPTNEITLCTFKLQNLQSQLLRFINAAKDDIEELEILSSKARHLRGRLSRVSSLPEVQEPASKLLITCDALLGICGKLGSDTVPPLDESIAFVSGFQIDPPDLTEMTLRKQIESSLHTNISSTPTKTIDIVGPSDRMTAVQSTEVSRQSPSTTLPAHIPVNQMEGSHQYTVLNQPESDNMPNREHPLSRQTFDMINAAPAQNLGDVITNQPINDGTRGTIRNVQFAAQPNQPQTLQMFPSNQPLNSTFSYQSTPPHKWKLKFAGSPSDTPVENFIFRVEHLAAKNRISLEQLTNDVCFLLEGSAREQYWLTLRCNPSSTWTEIRNSLLYRFQDRRSDCDIKQLIDARKQKPREPFAEFYYEILNLSLRLKIPIGDLDLMEILRKNMRSGLKIHLAGRYFASASEFVRICINTEDTWRNINYIPELNMNTRHPHINELDVQHSTMTPPQQFAQYSPQKETNVYEPYYTGDINAFQSRVQQINPSNSQNIRSNQRPSTFISCWNCGNAGHRFTDCDIPPRGIFCYGCGEPDILKPHCFTCSTKPGNRPQEMNVVGSSHFRSIQQRPNLQQTEIPNSEQKSA